MPVRDLDIRNALTSQLRQRFATEPGTVILQELGVHSGAARIDIAVVNGILHGFEIKSEADTLRRLPGQAAAYNSVFDEVTIVLSSVHERGIRKHIPKWWGICQIDRKLKIKVLRNPRRNPERDSLSIARLLWKDEALALLESKGLAKGFRAKNRSSIYERIASEIPLDELSQFVRLKLKLREDWRSDSVRT